MSDISDGMAKKTFELFAHGPEHHVIADLAARLAKAERALEEWEDAAKATDIYEYLTGALSRMGTVGPKGIREMVAYCVSLQRRAEAAERALEEANDGRPIETAPAQGEFLAYGSYLYEGDKHPTKYMMIAERSQSKEYPWERCEGLHSPSFFSRWRPLPSPPKEG